MAACSDKGVDSCRAVRRYLATQSGRHHVTGQTSLYLDRRLTSPWDAYVEYSGAFPQRGSPQQLTDFCTAYKPSPHQPLDVHCGFGLSSAAPVTSAASATPLAAMFQLNVTPAGDPLRRRLPARKQERATRSGPSLSFLKHITANGSCAFPLHFYMLMNRPVAVRHTFLRTFVISAVSLNASVRRLVHLSTSRCCFFAVCTALAALPLALHAQTQDSTQATVQAQPQIITVPVPSVPTGYTSAGPDWSRTGATSQISRAASADLPRTPPAPDVPTEFQTLVNQTLGRALPIFGADLFRNPPSTFAPVGDAQVTPDYIIGPGDEIRISATGQLNQQGTFTVDRAGTISIPDVGTLTVAGLRFNQLQPFLRQQIGRVYRNFELNVTLGQLRSIQIYILGQARQPGAYTVSSLSTLVNALFASGGILPQGSLRHIELQRAGQTLSVVDLYDLLLRGDKTKDIKLQPGDVIFVPPAGPQVAIAGSVTNPAIYELRGETTLNQLIQLANGLTATANGARVRVESVATGAVRSIQNVAVETSGTLAVHGGDIITVDPISDEFRNAVTLRGNVANPGRYAWRAGMRISDIIPDRASLITRGYYRSRTSLGQTVPAFQTAPQAVPTPAQGHVEVSTTPTAGTQNTGTRSDAPSATATNIANSSGGGTTVGDALTQNNGTFTQANDVILSAPDVDLAYAVIERLDPATLSTTLLPFNLGAVLNHTDPAQDLALEAGDVITIFSKADIRVPQSQQTRFVRLEGEFVSSGVYSVRPGETLRQLITRAGGLTPDAYLYASEFTRQSTRRVQQQRLNEYADSLEAQIASETSRQITTSFSPTGDTSNSIRLAADNARATVERLRATPPTGRIVLQLTPTSAGVASIPDIALEDGDRFIIPRQPSTVSVSGEVYNSSAFLFEPNREVRSYLRIAGGPSRYADTRRIFVIRADGSIVSRQYANVMKAPSLPGDTVVVPPQTTRGSLFREIATISSIASQLSIPLSLIALTR